MDFYQRATALILMSFFYQTAMAAESSDYSSEQVYFQEFPVVLSASHLLQPLSDAPNAMTVIDRKMIVASGFRAIPDLLKLVPGMYVSYYKGSQAFASYHGSTDQYARRMQVMIDGRSIYLSPVSTVDWSNLPITVDDIERIEVIRGPAAASHGANSTQGVISITTRDAGSVNSKSASYTHGTKGINDVSVRFGNTGEVFDYRMTLASMADNGYDDLSAPPHNIPLTRSRAATLLNNNNDSNAARLMNFRGGYHPNGVDSFDIQFGLNHDTQGVGFIDKDPTPSNPRSTNGNTLHDLISDSNFAQLEWVHQSGKDSELNMRYYHIQQDRDEAFPVYLGGRYFTGPVAQSIRSIRDELSVQHTLRSSDDNRLVYGAAYRQDQSEGISNIPPLSMALSASERLDEWRIFAHDEWSINPQLLVNIGGLLERDRMGHKNSSPRIAFNFHATPEHTLRIGSSVAYRTPALVEEKFPAIQPGDQIIPSAVVTSPGLKPERIVSHEIGYLGELRRWNTLLDLRLYSDQVSNGIYVDKVKSAFVNGLTANYQGFEATVKHKLDEQSDITFNYAHATANSNGPALITPGNNSLASSDPANADILSASIPRNSASVLYSQRIGNGLSMSASYFFQSSLQPFDRGPIDFQFTQRRMDVRVVQAFREVMGVKGELAFVIQNLFNQENTEYVANNVFDRRGYVTLTTNW